MRGMVSVPESYSVVLSGTPSGKQYSSLVRLMSLAPGLFRADDILVALANCETVHDFTRAPVTVKVMPAGE